MDESLLTAHVNILDTKLYLIHVPLLLYSAFLQPILQLILPSDPNAPEHAEGTSDHAKTPWAYRYPFVNVSITPVECSIVCSSWLARHLFMPIRETLNPESRSLVSISDEEFVVMQVDGEGLEAGQRVLDLTSPLAMNGISIFFITTYFSDYILVPLHSRSAVISALEVRGFAFAQQSEAFVSVSSPVIGPKTASTHLQQKQKQKHQHQHQRNSSSVSSLDQASTSEYFPTSPLEPHDESPEPGPATPSPSSISELEARTFATLKDRSIVPQVNKSIRLVHCAGRKDESCSSTMTSTGDLNTRLQLGLVRCLTTDPRPNFLSLTLTDTEAPSLLLEKRLLVNFESGPVGGRPTSNYGIPMGSGVESILLGSNQDVLVPITLDLRDLPMESTGIVCGIAGRLVGRTSSRAASREGRGHLDDIASSGQPADTLQDFQRTSGAVEMSYLSTARAGTVMVAEVELERALAALKGDETSS